MSALMAAAMNGNLDVVRLIVDQFKNTDKYPDITVEEDNVRDISLELEGIPTISFLQSST